MKTKQALNSKSALLTLALAVLGLLLIPSTSSAAIPSLSSTSEYKELQDYVLYLQGQEGIETPAAEIAIYQQELSDLVLAAQAKVTNLFERRRELANSQVSANRKKAVKKVRNKQRKNKRQAQKAFDRRQAQAKGNYRQQLAKINKRYNPKIASLKAEIKKLQKQQRLTRNPRKLAIIKDRLAQARVLIQNNQQDQQAAIKKAQRVQRQALQESKNKFNKTSRKIKRSADRQVKSLQNQYNQRFQQRMNGIRAQRSADNNSVVALQDSGLAAIALIPPTPEPEPTP